MAIVYIPKLKEECESKGYMPFVCIIKWTPEERQAATNIFAQIFVKKEVEEVKGVHTWDLIGRDTMIVIGWTNSPVSLFKLCRSVTYGTGITMDVCPAIDHFGLAKALAELKSLLPKTPIPKARARVSKSPKAGG